jgi:polar amino acid transport system substrate-binding protein
MQSMRWVRWTLLGSLLLTGCGGVAQPGANRTTAGTDAATRDESLRRVQRAGVLTWGADVVGGIPYVFEDPKRPGQYVGFEMDIAEGVARHLGVKLKLVVRAWDTLIPELQRGSFDMAMNGIEDTEDRRRIVSFSHPYYIYSQQITVRKGTHGIRRLEDLKGRRVATLSGTAAEDLLRGTKGVEVVVAPEIIYSYRDLERGKVDAVLLDTPIAAAYGAANPKLTNVGESFNEGRYIIAFRKQDRALLDAVNQALEAMKRSGELRGIYRKYGILDSHQDQIGV